LSAVYTITGGVHLNAVRIVQIILSLGIIWIVYLLGRTIFNEKCGLLAALIFAVYPSFIFFTHFVLTEVLFALLFLLFVYFFISFLKPQPRNPDAGADGSEIESKNKQDGPDVGPLNSKRRNWDIFLAGLFLGLGALTRSILYPFLGVAIVFVVCLCRGDLVKKIQWVFLLGLGFILVVSPWTFRNYKLYKSLVVIDTMGGLNMYLGNYEHTPLNRAWAAIDLTGDKTWFYGHEKDLAEMNEAQKQQWAMNKAREFILGHIGLTLKRDLIKAANFWGLEREVIGPIIAGHWPRLNRTSYLIVITFFVFGIYGIVTICSVFGILSHLQLRNKDILFCALLIVFFMGMHAIVFGHSRYHLPLMPLLGIFASWSLMNLKTLWKSRFPWRQIVGIALVIALIGIWGREIVFIEGARFLHNLHM
jgi:4-amino-4-deoxy-L-arabinose transferase-like glycosyltransferase